MFPDFRWTCASTSPRRGGSGGHKVLAVATVSTGDRSTNSGCDLQQQADGSEAADGNRVGPDRLSGRSLEHAGALRDATNPKNEARRVWGDFLDGGAYCEFRRT